MLPIRRLRARAGLFAALAGVVAISSALAIVLTGLVGAAATAGVRAELAASGGRDGILEMSLNLDRADPGGQDRIVREILARSFERGRTLRLDIDRSLVGSTRAEVTLPAGSPAPAAELAVLASVPDLVDHAELVDGRWPTTPGEASIQADAAAALGVEIGQTIGTAGTEFVVTGLWRLTPTSEPRWAADQLLLAGVRGADVGPLVIDETLWPDLEVDARAVWTLTPRPGTAQVSDLTGMIEAWQGLPFELRRDGRVETGNLSQHGRLTATIAEIQGRAVALSAVQPLPLLVIGAVALLALLEFGRLIAVLRAEESFLLWSRGADVGDVTRAAAVEAAVVAVVGAVLGAGVAVGLLSLAGDGAIGGAGAVLWAAPLIGVIAAGTAVAAETRRSLRAATATTRPELSRRRRRWAGAGLVALTSAVAIATTWQLHLYGSPLVVSGDGVPLVDPLAVLAPAAVLVAVVILLARAVPLLAGAVDERIARRAGVRAALVARSLLRRPALATVPIVLTALAVGQLIAAGSYSQSWDDVFTRTRELNAGTEVRLTTQTNALPEALVEPLAGVAGVGALAPVLERTVRLSGDDVDAVALTPRTLRELAADGAGAVDLGATAEAMDAGLPAATLPAESRIVRLALRLETFDGAPVTVPPVAATVVDAAGVARRIVFEPEESAGAAATVVAELPDDRPGPWTIAAVDVGPVTAPPAEAPPAEELPAAESTTDGGEPAEPDSGLRVELTALSAGPDGRTDVPLPESWTTSALDGVPPATIADQGPVVALIPGTLGRLLPTLAAGTDDLQPPVVISRPLAERLRIGVGDVVPLSLRVGFPDTSAEVAAILPAIPGADAAEAVLVDLRLLQALELRVAADSPIPTQWWVGADEPGVAGAALAEAAPTAVRVESLADDPARAMLGSAAVALWIGAVGATALAVAAVAAVLGVQRRERADEGRLLAALGLGAGERRALRRRELLVVLATGVVIGVLAGGAVTAVTLDPFALAAVPGAVAP